MANVTFVPTNDEALLAWSVNFNTKLTATPVPFGMTAAQATTYAAAHTAFAAALTAAGNPTTRTKETIAAKDIARDTLVGYARGYGRMIQSNPAVSDPQKISLGIKVRAAPTPVPPPSATPVIEFVSVVGTTVRIKLKATGRGKPAGVTGASIFSYTGATPPTDAAGFVFQGSTSKTLFDVVFPPSAAPGTRVWVCAFWFNGKMQSGPTCMPVSTYLQGGVIPMAA